MGRLHGVAGQRIYHFASKIREDGAVSALCFKTPRPINLKIASWTNRELAVTCPKCKRLLAAKGGNGVVKKLERKMP